MKNVHKAISWFLCRKLAGKKGGHAVCKVLKGKNLQPRILYPARLPFRIGGEIKELPRQAKTKNTEQLNPILKEMLKGLL